MVVQQMHSFIYIIARSIGDMIRKHEISPKTTAIRNHPCKMYDMLIIVSGLVLTSLLLFGDHFRWAHLPMLFRSADFERPADLKGEQM